MGNRTCSIDGCEREVHARAICSTHYRRWRRTGTTGLISRVRPLADRFWEKVDRSSGPTACWLWAASITADGYGQIYNEGKPWLAHRVAYELTHGPLPEGLVLDHRCRDRSCVNPAHLRPVTVGENLQNRGGLAISTNKTSGRLGVHWASRERRWRVGVRVDGRERWGGLYDDIEEATAAAKALRELIHPYSDPDYG